MKIILSNINTSIDTPASELKEIAARHAGISVSQIKNFKILRKSLDARKRASAHFCYSFELEGDFPQSFESKFTVVHEENKTPLIHGKIKLNDRPVVIGSGPCGLFAAYILAKEGYKPLVIERGSKIDEREKDFSKLCEKGELNEDSNVCFGEGGAGAFSDGKLTTRVKSRRVTDVLEIFTQHGADECIKYEALSHVGTEIIRKVVASMRDKIISLGGEFRYNTKFIGFRADDSGLKSITVKSGTDICEISAQCCVLATGHSARDTFEMLASKGVIMEPKAFAMGVRVEHLRKMIDKNQLGELAGHSALGAASYKLTARSGGRGVFSFCMCPGGEVVCSATEGGMTAVNGMSYSKREGTNSNSAIVCQVRTTDFSSGIFGGIELQRQIEKNAFDFAGGYGAPAMNIKDFLNKENSKKLSIASSYSPYVKIGDYSKCMPDFMTSALREGFASFEKSIKGFCGGIMLGVETRTSSPIRILRGEDGTAFFGFYPAGEGAGYAGGIVSAAVDGISCAEKIVLRYKEV